jgi:geranylgeranyl transferase type-2 subunit alpha
LLLTEIESLEELLDLEPDSKWVLQTLAHFLLQLEAFKLQNGTLESDEREIRTRALDMVDRLSSLDKYRAKRYQDWSKCVQAGRNASHCLQVLLITLNYRALYYNRAYYSGHGKNQV